MIFSHINRKKYFMRRLIKRPADICLLLLLFSVASIIAEKVELVLIGRLEKHIFEDKISAPGEAISYADCYAGNIWGGQVHGYHSGQPASDQVLYLIVSQVEQGNNEINVLVTIAESDYTEPGKEIFDAPVGAETTTGRENFAANTETESIGNLDLTPEEKLSLISLLNTLTDGYEQGRL